MDELIVKQALIEQRVDHLTREFIDELRKTNELLRDITERIQNLENDRMKAISFIGGIVFLATAMGACGSYLIRFLSETKLWD
jgi:hypothetical protein